MAAKKKPSKKTAPSAAKKVAKKATKKAATKVTKKAIPKKVAAKVAKKSTEKVAAKKAVAKKAAAKKTVAKKTVAKKKVVKAVAVVKPVNKVTEAPVLKPVVLKGFAKKQHQRLLDLRDGLLDAMYGVTHDTLKNTDGLETGAGGQHTGDAGSDSYDRDFALNLLAKEQDALSEIEQALARCDRGAYGICEMSGEKIPKERLEAVPFARFTVQCQMRWEQEDGQSKLKDGDSDFSFSSGAMR
jgi:DnaK suppressor protein